MKVVGESSGSEPKKSKSSISSSMNMSKETNKKSSDASNTLVKITIEHCTS